MGLFCRTFFAGEAIAANDIGAIAWFADPPLIDVWGLGTREVCRARQATGSHPAGWPHIDFLDDLVQQRRVAAILAYDRVLERYGDPRTVGWIRVGSWTIRDNQVCAQDEVSFWAPDSSRIPALARALGIFAPRLPASVARRVAG